MEANLKLVSALCLQVMVVFSTDLIYINDNLPGYHLLKDYITLEYLNAYPDHFLLLHPFLKNLPRASTCQLPIFVEVAADLVEINVETLLSKLNQLDSFLRMVTLTC